MSSPMQQKGSNNEAAIRAAIAAQANRAQQNLNRFSSPTITQLGKFYSPTATPLISGVSYVGTTSIPELTVDYAAEAGKKLLSQAPFVQDQGQRNWYKAGVLTIVCGVLVPVAKNPSLKHKYMDLGYLLASVHMTVSKISKKDIKHMSDNDLLNYVKHLRLDCNVGTLHLLKLVAGRFYREVQTRNKRTGRKYFAEAGYSKLNESEYSGKTDIQLFQAAIKFIKEFNEGKKRGERIETITDFMKAKGTPFWEDYRRQLNALKEDIERLSIKDKLVQHGILERQKRNLSAMTNKELIAEGLEIIGKNPGIKTIEQFAKEDGYLTGKLTERLGISLMLKKLNLTEAQAKPKLQPVNETPIFEFSEGTRSAILPTSVSMPEPVFSPVPSSPAQNEDERREHIYTVMKVNWKENVEDLAKDFPELGQEAAALGLITILEQRAKNDKSFLRKLGKRSPADMDRNGLLTELGRMKVQSLEELARY